MSRTLCFLAATVAAWAFAASPIAAQGFNPQRCGGRIVNQPESPIQPGCRRGMCQVSYRPAQDDKGVYCIRVFACHVICPQPKRDSDSQGVPSVGRSEGTPAPSRP
jgi:hypothetical protein